MTSDINIQLDFTSSTTLTSQLEEQLRLLITNMEEGDKLSPERILAKQLKVSRVTVRNAVNNLVKAGLLVRCGRHGTQIASRANVQHSLPLNDLAFGSPSFHPSIQLRFLQYETLPWQQEFWQEAFRRFNQKFSHYKIVPEYLPANVSSADFKEYLFRCGADIFQYNYGLNGSHMAQPLPDFVQQKMQNGDFFFARIPESEQIYLKHLMPLNSTMFRTYYNVDQAKRYGITALPGAAGIGQDHLKFIFNSAKALPETITAAGRIWDYARHEVMRHPGSLEEALLEFCQRCEPAVGQKNAFLLFEEKPLDSVEKLFAGQLFSLSIGTPHFQALVNGQNLVFASELLQPAAFVPSVAMGIASNCLYQEAAGSFLEFLLSEEIQYLLASCKKSIPMHRKAWYEYAATEEKMSRKEADNYISSAMFLSDDGKNPLLQKSNFLTFFLHKEWAEFCQGKMSAEETVEKIMKKFLNSFPLKANGISAS